VADILNAINITSVELLIPIAGLLAAVIVLFVLNAKQKERIRQLNIRCDRFMADSDGRSLEQAIADNFADNREIREAIKHDEKLIENIYFRLKCVVQKTGVVKYDAFSQMGGLLSYALALLDENDCGVVINSVHSSDGCYTYVKTIKNGRPDVDLGAEEQQALQQAMSGFHKTKIESDAVEALRKQV
jgi:hypothetical protein